jgi:hypothetical protein
MSYLNIEVHFTSPSIVHTTLLTSLLTYKTTFDLADHNLLFLPTNVCYNLL